MNRKREILSFFFDGILSGIMLTIGATAFLSSGNRYLGAFLFTIGLFCIVRFKFGLYTGKVGYIVNRSGGYIAEVLLTLAANCVGTLLGAKMLCLTRLKSAKVSELGISVVERARQMMSVKINDSFLSSFFLAVFCGVLMFCAVEAYRKCCEDKNGCGAVFGVVMPVFVFIVCGFNHCVADMAYYFIAGSPLSAAAALYFAAAILGNAVGAVIIPLLKKLSNQPL